MTKRGQREHGIAREGGGGGGRRRERKSSLEGREGKEMKGPAISMLPKDEKKSRLDWLIADCYHPIREKERG